MRESPWKCATSRSPAKNETPSPYRDDRAVTPGSSAKRRSSSVLRDLLVPRATSKMPPPSMHQGTARSRFRAPPEAMRR